MPAAPEFTKFVPQLEPTSMLYGWFENGMSVGDTP
jgi:hypothetical protein